MDWTAHTYQKTNKNKRKQMKETGMIDPGSKKNEMSV